MSGRGISASGLIRGLAEEDLAQVVLQEERVGDPKAGEQPDDVAVQQDRLAAAGCRIGPVLQVHLVDDDVLRVPRIASLRRPEKPEQRAVGTKHARELIGERLAGRLVHVVDEIPAENPVDGRFFLWKPLFEKGGEFVELAAANMAIEVREDILDENLAAELLAKETDVAADDRPEIEQDGRLLRGERGQKLPKGFRGKDGVVDRIRGGEVRIGSTRRETI